VVLRSAERPVAALLVDIDPDSGLITTIRLIGNPDKLAGLGTDPTRPT
jgi:hypothetical protein